VPIRMKSSCTSDRRRFMSLLHRASRHSRYSPSITSHFGSATTLISLTPTAFLSRRADKANLRFVAIQNKSVRGESERFPVECSTTQVIGVEAQQEVMAALGAKRKAARRRAVHGDKRFDRGEAVAAGLYPALVVGGDEPLSPGRSVGADRVEPVSLRPEAGRLDGEADFAGRRGVVPDQFKARRRGFGPSGQANGLAVERPVTFG